MCFAAQPNVGMSVCMCVSSLNKSPVHSDLCVCVCVCVSCSAPGSAIKEAPRDVRVFVRTKDQG